MMREREKERERVEEGHVHGAICRRRDTKRHSDEHSSGGNRVLGRIHP